MLTTSSRSIAVNSDGCTTRVVGNAGSGSGRMSSVRDRVSPLPRCRVWGGSAESTRSSSGQAATNRERRAIKRAFAAANNALPASGYAETDDPLTHGSPCAMLGIHHNATRDTPSPSPIKGRKLRNVGNIGAVRCGKNFVQAKCSPHFAFLFLNDIRRRTESANRGSRPPVEGSVE